MICIVNVTENWGIGHENKLLVSISADLKRFRRLTEGKVVVLGRKTLETFPNGQPLKNRTNLILSQNPDYTVPGAQVVHSIPELLTALKDYPSEQICIIGGASIYEAMLPYCSTARITRTLLTPEADRYFPNLDETEGWVCAAESPTQAENDVSFQYVDYVNLSPLSL